MRRSVAHLYGRAPVGENLGQFLHRLQNPVSLFANDDAWQVFSLSIFDPDFTETSLACDLLVIHELIAPELESLILARRALTKPTLFEIADQVLAAGDWLPRNHGLLSPLNRATLLNLGALSDGVIFSSHGLEQSFRELNTVRAVLDNLVAIPAVRPEKPEGFVFGWAGTVTHRADLLSIAPGIAAFCKRHPDAKFALMGHLAELAPLFSEIPRAQLELREFGSYKAYLDFLRGLHVGLAPLLPSAFNQGRTDVKLIEYTVCGAAAVVSKHEVYQPHRAHALLFDGEAELLAALEHLYAAPGARAGLVDRALEWVQSQRSPAAIRRQHIALFQTLLGQGACTPVHRKAPDLAAQTELHNALRAREAGQHQRALELAQGLLEAHPDWHYLGYLALLCLQSLGRDLELIQWARGLPESLYSPLIAEAAHQSALRLQPEGAAEFLPRCSALTRARFKAKTHEPRVQFETVLEHRPFDYFALHGLIHWLERTEPDSPRLPGLRERLELFSKSGTP